MNPQEVAQTVLDFIELNPTKHSQSDWAQIGECGTTGCIAGWTGMLALGWKPHTPDWLDEKEKKDGWSVAAFKTKDGKKLYDKDFVPLAGRALGLNEADANDLFSLIDEEAAKEALRYIANGKKLDWKKIGKDYDIERLEFYFYVPFRDSEG